MQVPRVQADVAALLVVNEAKADAAEAVGIGLEFGRPHAVRADRFEQRPVIVAEAKTGVVFIHGKGGTELASSSVARAY